VSLNTRKLRINGVRVVDVTASRFIASELYASERQEHPVKRVNYDVVGRDRYTGYQQALGADTENRTADIIPLSESYTYNELGQVAEVSIDFGPFTKSYQYTYYPNGLKKTYTNPEGITYTYYYNKNNQFAALHIPGAGQISHSNFEWMQPQTIVFPGGSQIQLSYEDFQRVEQRVLKDPEQEDKASAFYDYDLVGDIESINTEHGLYSFGYDSLYRLTTAAYPAAVAANDEGFDYDGVGNRTSHTFAPDTGESEQIESTYNEQNQLISQTKDGVTTTFTYNDNGHTATKTTMQGTVEYVYNHEERLIAVKRDGSVVGEYAYDPLGRRVKKTAGGDTTWFMYTDGGLAAEYDAAGILIVEYQFTPYSTWMTDPLMQRRNGQLYYYQNDHLGTPQRMVDGAGQVVWEARYSAFGKATLFAELEENDLRFPGQYFDGENGLHHNYFRDFDPTLGRYVQSDPIGILGGRNSYVYAYGMPGYAVDPRGLSSVYRTTGRPPPDDTYGTIVCDGKGNVVPWVNPDKVPKNNPAKKCIDDCAVVHESVHVDQVNTSSPRLCEGVAKNSHIKLSMGNNSYLRSIELPAYLAERDCLRKKKDAECPDDECKDGVADRLEFVNEQISNNGGLGRPPAPPSPPPLGW